MQILKIGILVFCVSFSHANNGTSFNVTDTLKIRNKNTANIKPYQLTTIRNIQFIANVTHNLVNDLHNSVLLFWGRNDTRDIYLETKDYFDNRKSRPFYYKLRKNDQSQWKIKNITSSISEKKIQRMVSRSSTTTENSSKKFRLKRLPNGSERLIVSESKSKKNIKIFPARVSDNFKNFLFVDFESNVLIFCGMVDDFHSSLTMVNFFPRTGKRVSFNFSVTLENAICIDPKINFPDTYLSSSLESPLIDVERITNSRGVIVASQLQQKLTLEEARMLDVNHFRTMITFDHGKQWTTLRLQNDCQSQDPSEPYLYLDLSFSRLHFDQSHLGIVKGLESSPGVVVATGHLAYHHNPSATFPGIFVSHDGGLNWKKVFHERLMLTLARPKWEILLAVRNCLTGFTKRIYISNDIGNNWKLHDIFAQEVCVHEALSGGWGDVSSVFVLLSTRPEYEGWIVTLIDFDGIVAKTCKKSEVQLWPPKSVGQFCVHGRKILKYRRQSNRLCDTSDVDNFFTKFSYNCSCSKDDLKCLNGSECPVLSKKVMMDFSNMHLNSNYNYLSKKNSSYLEIDSSNMKDLTYISDDSYHNFLKSLGYIRRQQNFCRISKSVFLSKPKKVCQVNLDMKYYFSQASNNFPLFNYVFLVVISTFVLT